MHKMDCRRAESMVNHYINHTLTDEDLEDFIDHVEKCRSCYDELETAYIVNAAVSQLGDDETGEDLDFQRLLEQDLHRSHKYLRKHRMLHILYGVLMILVAAAFVIFVLYALQV